MQTRDDDEADTWVVRCDGSAVPNPGRMGLGAVVVAPGCAAPHRLSERTPFTGCNNEAELRALLMALRFIDDICHPAGGPAAARGCLQVISDSSLLVEQLGRHPPPQPVARLAALFDTARARLRAWNAVQLHWVPRHRNAEADALARAALGLAPKSGPRAAARAGRRM